MKTYLKTVLSLAAAATALFAQDDPRTADPSMALRQYSIFGADSIYCDASANFTTMDSGYIGSNGTFKFSDWSKISINEIIRIRGNLKLGSGIADGHRIIKRGGQVMGDLVQNRGQQTGFTITETLQYGGTSNVDPGTPFHDPSINIDFLPFAKAELVWDETRDAVWDHSLRQWIVKESRVAVDTTAILPAGKYREVSGGFGGDTSYFGAGNYYITTLKLTGGGTGLVVKNEGFLTRILIKDSFVFDGGAGSFIRVGGADKSFDSTYAGNLLIYVDSDSKNAIKFNSGSTLHGTLFAPNTQIDLKSEMKLIGQAIAKVIRIGNNFDGEGGGFGGYTPEPPSPIEVIDTFPDVVVYEDSDPTNMGNANSKFKSDKLLTFKVNTSNSELVVPKINSKGKLTLIYRKNRNGAAKIEVRAYDGDQFVADTFNVTVLPIGDIFDITDTIADITVSEDAPNTVIRLDSLVSSDSVLTFSALSMDESLVTATVDINGNLVLDYQPDQHGVTMVTATVTEHDSSLTDTFTVTVLPVWDPIVRIDSIANVSVEEDADTDTITIDIPTYAKTDMENKLVRLYVDSLSDSSIADFTVLAGGFLEIDYKENAFGSALCYFSATDDSGYSALDTFTLTVASVNDTPYVTKPYDDIVTIERDTAFDTLAGTLSGHFADIEDDWVYGSVSSDDSTLAIPVLGQDDITVRIRPFKQGECIITVIASDQEGAAVSQQFKVIVEPNPNINSFDTIPDITVLEDALDYIVDLQVYTDVVGTLEGDISYSATVENETLLTATPSNSTGLLTLDFLDDQHGETDVIVTATDGQTTVADTFHVTVVSVWDPVRLKDNTYNMYRDEDDSARFFIKLSKYFYSPESSQLKFSITLNHSPKVGGGAADIYDEYVVRPLSDTADSVWIELEPNAHGWTDFFFVATDDSGYSAKDTSRVTVIPIVDGPVLDGTIPDTTVEEDTDSIYYGNMFDYFGNYEYFATLKASVVSIDSLLLRSVMRDDKFLTLYPRSNANGECDVIVKAENLQGGAPAFDTFHVTITPVDDITEIEDTIADVRVWEDAVPTVIDLDSIVNADLILNYVATVADSSLLVPSTDGNGFLTLTYQPDQNGKTSVMVTATDSAGVSVHDTFTVIVLPVWDDPIVVNPLPDTTVIEDAVSSLFDLELLGTFDGESALKYSVVSLNDSLVNASIGGSLLTLDYQPNRHGVTSIIVTATDFLHRKVSDTMVVTVIPVAEPPVVIDTIADVTVYEDADPTTISDISNYFSDDDSIVYYSVASGNSRLVIPMLDSDNNLTLTYRENQNGETDITVTAHDGVDSVQETFHVTVIPVDDPSEITDTIADVLVYEDAAPTVIDLDSIVKLDIHLTYAAVSLNPALVTPSADNSTGYLTLTYGAGLFGETDVIVQAKDEKGATVVDTFHVTVVPVWDFPIRVNPLPDYTVVEDAPDSTVLLTGVFEGESEFTYALRSLDTSLVEAVLDAKGSSMVLRFQNNQFGETDVIVVGMDTKGNTVYDTAHITVIEVVEPPVRDISLPDTTVMEDADPIDMGNLFDFFSDDDSALTFTATSGDARLLNAEVDSLGNLTVNVRHNNHGETDVVVIASDGALSTADTFHVTVTPVDDPTDIRDTIADVVVPQNSAPTVIDLDSIVKLDLHLTYSSISFNSELVVPTVDNDLGYLTLAYAPDKVGLTKVAVTAVDSEGETVADTFRVLIYPVWEKPSVVDTIPDTTVNEDDPAVVMLVSDYFTGQEALNYTVVSSKPSLVMPTVANDEVTLNFGTNQFGIADIAVIGTDSRGNSVSDTFTVTVLEVIEPPFITKTFADITVDEDAIPKLVGTISAHFDDVDDSILTYEVHSFDSALIDPVVTLEEILVVRFNHNANGSTPVVVTASDGANEVSDTFNVTINPVVDPFELTDTVPDVTVYEDAPDSVIDLNAIVSSDILLVYTVSSEEPSLVTASVNLFGKMTLSFQPDQNGETDVIVHATDGESVVADTFHVTVLPVDDEPIVVNPMSDIEVLEDATPLMISIDSVFLGESSIDVRPATTDADLFAVELSGDTAVILTFQKDAFGVAELMLVATDHSGLSKTDIANVVVHPVNDAPVIISKDLGHFDAWSDIATELVVEDVDDSIFHWRIFAQPQGLDLNSETGEIHWSPEGTHIGYSSFLVEVVDLHGAADTAAQSITIYKEGTAPKDTMDELRAEDFSVNPPVLKDDASVITFTVSDENLRSAELVVLDPVGNRVFKECSDQNEITWDGRNESDRFVEGTFTAILKVTDSEGNKKVMRRLIGIQAR